MVKPLAASLLLALACAPLARLRADDTRVLIANVNGQPVYHSELFKSQKVKDDVDRALILQEYERSEQVLPPELVGTALQNIIKENYGGDSKRLIAELQRHHATPEDYVRYLTEEIVLTAMLDQHKDDVKGQWIADLRKSATIEKPKPGENPVPSMPTVLPAPTPAATPARRVPDPRRKPDPTPTPAPGPR